LNHIFTKKLTRYSFGTVFLLLVTLSSCIFAPMHKVSTFDLGVPKTIALRGIRLYVMPFMNNTETAFQMLYRTGKFQVEKDAYNRWIKTPGILVTSYLRDSFRCNKSTERDYILSGEIILFEINLEKKYTMLSVNYRIKHKGKYIIKKEATFKQTFDKASPVYFAEAMSKAVSTFAEDIKAELINYDKAN
jgi:hypothetical protein